MILSQENIEDFLHIQNGSYEQLTLMKKLMKISRNSRANLNDYDYRFFIDFYSNSDNYEMLERAPVIVQRQYLNSFPLQYNNDVLEKFIKLNETLGYPDARIMDRLGYDVSFVDIDVSFSISSDRDNYESSKNLYETLLDLKMDRLKRKTADSNPNNRTNYNIAKYSPSDTVAELKEIHHTVIFLLMRVFGEEVISEIVKRAVSEDLDIDVFDILPLVEDWVELKDYPIAWSYEVIKNSSFSESKIEIVE